jgi:hypothetical protein
MRGELRRVMQRERTGEYGYKVRDSDVATTVVLEERQLKAKCRHGSYDEGSERCLLAL